MLPTYKIPGVRPLNIDADLYSSTICVLRALRDEIVPGTYLHFDESFSLAHELRAFKGFVDESGLTFRLVGADRSLHDVAFQAT